MILNPPIMPKPETQADWAEASCMFGEDECVFKDDLRGVLNNVNIGNNKGKRRGYLVDDIWREINWRKAILGDLYPFTIYNDHMKRNKDWTKTLAYSYMLILSIHGFNKTQTQKRINAKSESRPFLRFVSTCLKEYLPLSVMFDFPHEGPIPKGTDKAFETLCKIIGETPYPKPPIKRSEKDGGADLVIWHPLDKRTGKIIILVQCTLEEGWEKSADKIKLSRWIQFAQWAVDPMVSLAVPFVAHSEWHSCCRSGGILFDRLRLTSLASKTKHYFGRSSREFMLKTQQELNWYQ